MPRPAHDRRTLSLLVLLALAVLSSSLSAQLLFIEDFDDKDLSNGPGVWSGADSESYIDLSSGDLLFGTSGRRTFLKLENVTPGTDWSVRALVQLRDWSVGIGLNEPWNTGAQLAAADGQAGFYLTGQSTQVRTERGAGFPSPIAQDYFIQLDSSTEGLQAWAWPAGVVGDHVKTLNLRAKASTAWVPSLSTHTYGAVTNTPESEGLFKQVQVAKSHLPLPEPHVKSTLMLAGATGDYWEDFDSLASQTDVLFLPTGWSGSSIGGEDWEYIAVNRGLNLGAERRKIAGTGDFYDLGPEGSSDRAFGTGLRHRNSPNRMELQTQVVDTDARGLRLRFDIEAWATATGAEDPGEAAFDVLLEMNTGNGFEPLGEFPRQSTGPRLVEPTRGEPLLVDGNSDAFRTSIDLAVPNVEIPAGAELRIGWTTSAGRDIETKGWIYGLDNLHLQLSPIPGDVDGDRAVTFPDFLTLAANFDKPGGWGQGDFDGNGHVEFPDFLLLAKNFERSSAAAAVPEPDGCTLSLPLLLLGLALRRRRTR